MALPRPRTWKGTKKALGHRMCHICKLASVKSPGDGNYLKGASSTTYTDVFGRGWAGSDESLLEFRESLVNANRLVTASYFHNTFMFNDPLHVIYKGCAVAFVTSSILFMARAGAS